MIHMSSRISKAVILDACIARQEELIQHFDQRIEEVKADAYSHSETPSQTDEGASAPEEMLEVMGQELRFVKSEMEILRSIDPENPATVVERGAVVVTDKRTFFIAVSSEELDLEGAKIFGMSEKAPLYGHMKGLKKEDSFSFNGMTYHIQDIY